MPSSIISPEKWAFGSGSNEAIWLAGKFLVLLWGILNSPSTSDLVVSFGKTRHPEDFWRPMNCGMAFLVQPISVDGRVA